MSGLLAALGRGLEAAGETASKGIFMNMQHQHESEMAQAQALREENLTRLRASLGEVSADNQRAFEREKMNTEFDRGPSGMIDYSTGKPLTRGEAKAADPDSIISPEDDKISGDYLVDGKPASNSDVKVALQDKPDSVTRVKEVDAESKMAAMKEVTEMKIAAAKTEIELKARYAEQLLQVKLQAGKSKESDEVKKIMADIRKTEEQRKAADSAAKLLDATGGEMNPEQKKLYDNYLTMAGVDTTPASSAAAKPKKKGLLASMFGGDDASAAPPAQTPAPAPQRATGQYDYNSLPKGSQPVPGKFTKDGRPVFKTAKGKLIAPQLIQ